MHELFNPAGLRMVEDKNGAIAYGWIAPRVCYTKFVGALSAELGSSFVRQLEALVREVPALTYFGDASALSQYDLIARLRFQRFVESERRKFAALIVLTWAEGISPAARAFEQAIGDIARVVADPLEFEGALANVAPVRQPFTHAGPVWQVHAPR